jgi:tRNA nucleotidyltransferase (CCA-adding enzyme)
MAPQKPELPKERIWEEWKKWALKGVKPSLGLKLLVDVDWADPEIVALVDCPQDSEWHPEGTVEVHTGHVVDAAAVIADRDQLDEHDRLVLLLAALCHDFGKPSTTKMEGGRWRSKRHCQAGVEHAERFLGRIGAPLAIIAEVLPLISEHLVHAGVKDPSDRAVRRLANRLYPSNIHMLSMLVQADHNGRPPLPHGNPLALWVSIADKLDVINQPPIAILKGRHLIPLGVKPGKEMGKMLTLALEAQLDGKFSNLQEGVAWLVLEFDLSDHPPSNDECGDN